MNKQELRFLEKAFEAEINFALSQNSMPHFIQSKSKIVEKLVNEGFLEKISNIYSGMKLDGYELTHLGRLTYCLSCSDIETH